MSVKQVCLIKLEAGTNMSPSLSSLFLLNKIYLFYHQGPKKAVPNANPPIAPNAIGKILRPPKP